MVRSFGKIKDGTEVSCYTIRNNNGMEVDILDFGGIIRSIRLPLKNEVRDVVIGYDDALGYENGTEYFGATVGRCCGQVENATYTLDGKEYHLTANYLTHNMHGGFKGFSYRMFKMIECTDNSVTLEKFSPDGEEGFPGNLTFRVTFSLNDDNELKLYYDGVSDKDTLLDVTNHSYFNLDGFMNSETINTHWLMMDADLFSEVNSDGVPTGVFTDVTNTPMDFREPHLVGERVNADYGQLKIYGGYDHCFIFNNKELNDKPQIVLENMSRTIKMETYTDYPSVQFYAGNSITSEMIGKEGKPLAYRQALCLETQYPTNAMAHPNFPSIVLRAGEKYEQTTIYKFYY